MLLLLICVFWFTRISTASRLVRSYLEDNGFQKAEFDLVSLQLDSLEVENVTLERDETSLQLRKLSLSYDLSELINNQRIQEAHIEGATLVQALESGESSPSEDTDSFVLEDLQTYFSYFDLSAIGPLPFDRIQIADSTTEFVIDGKTISPKIEATFVAKADQSLDIELQLEEPSGTLHLLGTLYDPNTSEFSLDLRLKDPSQALSYWYPDWRNSLPDLSRIESGPVEIQIKLPAAVQDSRNIDFSIEIQDLRTDYEEVVAQIPRLSLRSSFNSFDNIPATLEFSVQQLARDTLSLSPDSNLKFGIELKDFSFLKIQSLTPIPWNYDTDYISGSSKLTATYKLNDETAPLWAVLEDPQIELSDYTLTPLFAELEGDFDELRFTTEELGLADFPEHRLSAGYGNILIPEDETEPIAVTFNAESLSDPIILNEETAGIPVFTISLSTEVGDESTRSLITVASKDQQSYLNLPGLATLKGTLAANVDLNQSEATELFTGSVKLDASNLSIQSEPLSGNGVNIQSLISFRDLDSDSLTSDEFPSEPTIADLLDKLQVTLDWQANELDLPNASAKWSGGSHSLAGIDGSIQFSNTLSLGIVALDTIQVEQVYVENSNQGSLSQMSGSVAFSSLLAGTSIELSSKYEALDLLDEPKLSGDFELSPISLFHSDLPSLLIPELAGLTVSGNLSASGSFHSDRDSSDSSFHTILQEGLVEYPASQITASGIEVDLQVDSLANLDSAEHRSRLTIDKLKAGDFEAHDAKAQFRILEGTQLAIDSADVSLFDGKALLRTSDIPIDGSDFQSSVRLEHLSLAELSRYAQSFEGEMDGRLSGELPFRVKDGEFQLLRGSLNLPPNTTATLLYNTKGLLTEDDTEAPAEKPTFSDRVLKFLKIDPDRAAEEALGNITLTRFDAELFPEDSPDMPITIRMEGTAHSGVAEIPVVISTQVFGSMSELYNFLIRLNSL